MTTGCYFPNNIIQWRFATKDLQHGLIWVKHYILWELYYTIFVSHWNVLDQMKMADVMAFYLFGYFNAIRIYYMAIALQLCATYE